MKLTLAVLALVCLSSAVSASSNAADFKLPLAGLFAGHGNVLAEANLTVGDLVPHVNVNDIMTIVHAMPKFQIPTFNVSGMGSLSLGNASELMVPLVPLMGLKAAKKALPLMSILSMLNATHSVDVNFTMPSLPSVNVSQMAVPLHALLALPKAHKALPLGALLSVLNATSSLNISLPHPQLPQLNLNLSDVGVPLGFLLGHKVKGIPLLGLVANATAALPVFTTNVTVPFHAIGALPFKAILGLKALPLALASKALNVTSMSDIALSALSGLSFNKTISATPLGGLAALSKSVNISDLPLSLLAGKAGLLSGLVAGMGNITAGPSVDVNLRHGSVGMKNIALNLTHPTLGLKNLAVALNITHPELAMKLAALNLSLPVPDVRMGSKNVSVSVPLLDINPQLSNITVDVPMLGLTMPSLSLDVNASLDGNNTNFLKNIQITKPGLTLGSANVTLPMLSPQVALKLAQLGFNVPTAELGLKKANINAALPVPDLSLAQKAVNLTVPFPDVGMKQFGVNLTVPDIQLPRLEVNVSGMPRLGLDALKSATLLSWLKDAGFYAMKNITLDGNTTIDLIHHG